MFTNNLVLLVQYYNHTVLNPRLYDKIFIVKYCFIC